MKDFDGNSVNIGDIVAVIYHPEPYKFSVEAAEIMSVKGKNKLLTTRLLKGKATPSFYPDKVEGLYKKIVKIKASFCNDADCPVDAVGQKISVGDRIACRRATEAGGNTVKGFDKGGVVTRITKYYAFYLDIDGVEKRKGLGGVVVY